MTQPFDLTTTPVHLGLGATVEPLYDFRWAPEYLDAHIESRAGDGYEGRLVSMFTFTESWPTWEVHPHGSELVLCVSGLAILHQLVDGARRTVELGPGQAIVNPPGVWHTADINRPTTMVFITAGVDTINHPREGVEAGGFPPGRGA